MWKPVCILISVLAVSTPATADIYKCVKEKNETVYQNFPCHIDSIGSQATAAPPTESAAAAKPGNTSATPSTTTTTVQGGGVAGGVPVVKNTDGKYEPRVGMTRRQVRRLSWGEPDEITRTDEGDYVWTYPDKRVLRFDDKGRLTSVQR